MVSMTPSNGLPSTRDSRAGRALPHDRIEAGDGLGVALRRQRHPAHRERAALQRLPPIAREELAELRIAEVLWRLDSGLDALSERLGHRRRRRALGHE